jgi:3-dehydroquinate synthetase
LNYGPLPTLSFSTAQIVRLISSDKKTIGGVPHFMLISKVGETAIADNVPAQAIADALGSLKKLAKAIR